MVGALAQEMEQRADYLEGAPLQSIYFGGGTPSLLDRHELEFLFDQILSHWEITANAEVTLEANPDDLTRPYLEMLRDTPVNRLSIGIQSFDDQVLQWMNRAHDSEQALRSLENALDLGFHRITADLIYGIPNRSLHDWERELDTFMSFRIGHLSAYALTIEPRTALGNWVSKGRAQPAPDDDVRQQFEMLMDKTEAAGLEHYEISNFARPGQRAVHNANYWKGVSYLGIGPSAHSYDGRSREWNVAHNIQYMEGVERGQRPFERELLTPADRYNEYVMTRLRTDRGVSRNELESMGKEWLDLFLSYLPEVEKRIWVRERTPGTWVLTREGKHWADQAAAEFFKTD